MKRSKQGAALLTVFAFVIVLAGCQGAAMKPMDPDPEPELTPREMLLGTTWRTTERPYWEDGDEPAGITRETITFAGERWIRYREHVRHDGTVVDGRGWFDSGGWTATDNVITRMWVDHDDDDTEKSVEREYYLHGGDVLVLRDWNPDAQGPGLYQYEKVKDAYGRPEIVGTWERNLDGETTNITQRTIDLKADGTFQFTVRGADWQYVLAGNYTHDAENMYINMTDLTASRNDESREFRMGDGSPTRIAYAPMGDGGIGVSGWWNEPEDPDHELPKEKYGGYYRRYYRVSE